ncbi:MAG: hypothetical protein WCC84_09305 [Candidatus Cybelea sp.]
MATQLESGSPASARPTGTVTFAFSDIEGSTQTLGPRSGGCVFKTIGDAVACLSRIFWSKDSA